jgi:hypothetical protein
MEYIPVHSKTAKLDLSLEAVREKEAYTFHFEYASSLFLPETIAIYGRSFESVLARILSGGKADIDEISAVSPYDKLNFIDRPGRTYNPYLDMPIHNIFEGRPCFPPGKRLSNGTARRPRLIRATRRQTRQRAC